MPGDCPEEFYKIDNHCFYISKHKVSWIEARKHCEKKQSALLALESEAKAIRLSNLVETISQRHFNEFWTSGNDIEVEGAWHWAGLGEGASSEVPSFGWSEESFRSRLEHSSSEIQILLTPDLLCHKNLGSDLGPRVDQSVQVAGGELPGVGGGGGEGPGQ